MLRKELEAKLAAKGTTQIDIFRKAEDTIAVYCVVRGGHIKDYTNHVICGMNEDLDSCIVWLGGGNADRVKFDNSEEKIPFMRNGLRVDGNN